MRSVGIRLVLLAALLAVVPLACRRPSRPTQQATVETVPTEKPASRFDPKNSGAIKGTVLWTDELPHIHPLHVLNPVDGNGTEDFQNPNDPKIDPDTGQVKGALVFLRKVDPVISKPWSHAPVSVVFTEDNLEVRQGAAPVPVGIVQLGDTIGCSATVERRFVLVARGAADRGTAFFSLEIPAPNVVKNRKLDKAGAVSLTCGRGRYWLQEYIWVSDHPYVAVTKEDGSFDLKKVPAGDYELVSWLPNWHVRQKIRSPETSEITGLIFEPPVEEKRFVTVTAGETAEIEFSWSLADFRHREND